MYLLWFKLIFASPVEKDITTPKANKEENGVDFDGGEAGSMERPLRIAMSNHAVA